MKNFEAGWHCTFPKFKSVYSFFPPLKVQSLQEKILDYVRLTIHQESQSARNKISYKNLKRNTHQIRFIKHTRSSHSVSVLSVIYFVYNRSQGTKKDPRCSEWEWIHYRYQLGCPLLVRHYIRPQMQWKRTTLNRKYVVYFLPILICWGSIATPRIWE